MASDLHIEEILEKQAELQARYRDMWGGLSPEKGRDSLLWMIIEAGEAADLIKKRGDDAVLKDEAVRADFVEELCDVMMFLGDVMLCYDITAQEVTDSYRKKHDRNMNRWK